MGDGSKASLASSWSKTPTLKSKHCLRSRIANQSRSCPSKNARTKLAPRMEVVPREHILKEVPIMLASVRKVATEGSMVGEVD